MDVIENKAPVKKGENEKLRDELVRLYGLFIPDELKQSLDPVRVISVACGPFVQEMSAIFTHIPNAQYTGIDNSLTPDAIQRMIEEYPQYPNFKIVNADATNAESIGDSVWDLAVLRNPQIGFSSSRSQILPSWESIITNTVNGIRPGGYLLLSGMSEDEFARSFQFVQSMGVMKALKGQSPINPPIASNFPMVERGVALLQKTSLKR